MNSKERAKLKGFASLMEPIFQVGKIGINENFIIQIQDALKARELIKINVLETSPIEPREFSIEIAKQTDSQVVQVIGRKVILYKKKKKDSKYGI